VKRSRAFDRRVVLGLAAALVLATAVPRGHWSGPTALLAAAGPPAQRPSPFTVEEATIDDLHRAIQDGRTTCEGVVRAYIDRARAYNGACTTLVTKDGAPVVAASGAMRAGRRVSFPTRTRPVSDVLPDVDKYTGALDYGRMGTTASDPNVQQQYGMVAGISGAGQVNALSTLNIRGERSVTCQAACDAPVSSGALPASCAAACDTFRRQPDALERAAQLDAKYGRKPDLAAMPMYCVALSFKDVFDTTDMRTTGGADVNYAMDAAPADATIVARLRAKGAIIYAKANLDEYNAGSGDPGGTAKPAAPEYGAGARSTWGGMACNPYDTERETGGSSSGSAASVAANLAACSVCEETGGSCRQPAWRNGVVGFVTTKGLLPYGGAIGADPYLDRAGTQCRTVTDTARVLDAIKDSAAGYFDPRDPYSALPAAFTPSASYVSLTAATGAKPLAGVRVGIVREYMVKHAANDRAMSDLVNAEIIGVLRDRLGATLVESVDPLYPDDPAIPNMTYTFQRAIAEILPFHMPEYLQRRRADKTLLYAVDGFDVTTRDYLVKLAEGQAPLSDRLNLRSINNGPPSAGFAFDLARYLLRRGDARVMDWATLNANATYHSESRVAAMKNWENRTDLASDGITNNIVRRDVMRMVLEKVMRENRLDVLVNPTTTIPPAKIGFADQPTVNDRPVGRYPTSANAGIPEITVPAGFNRIVYDPSFALTPARTGYNSVANEDHPTTLEAALPVGISIWAGPGDEASILRVAAAYERATHHRRPPSAFGVVAPEGRTTPMPQANGQKPSRSGR